MSTPKDITPLGQAILDTILDVVTASPEMGMGFHGWEIGKTVEITAYVAKKLGKANKSIDGGLAHLVAKGYLSNVSHNEDTDETKIGIKLACTHKGWLAYSLWDERKGLQGEQTLDDWLNWDGIDGQPYPYSYPLPDWNKLSAPPSELLPIGKQSIITEPATQEPGTAIAVPQDSPESICDMTDEQFAAYAGTDAEVAAQQIKNAIAKLQLCFKRSAAWYWIAGRWLVYVQDNHLYGKHGDWGAWCKKECGISRQTAHRYTKFYFSTTADETKCLTNETFNLAKALGYELTRFKPEDEEVEDETSPAESDEEACPHGIKPKESCFFCKKTKAKPESEQESDGEQKETPTPTQRKMPRRATTKARKVGGGKRHPQVVTPDERVSGFALYTTDEDMPQDSPLNNYPGGKADHPPVNRTWFKTLDEAKAAAKSTCGKKAKLRWRWDEGEQRWEGTARRHLSGSPGTYIDDERFGFTIYEETVKGEQDEKEDDGCTFELTLAGPGESFLTITAGQYDVVNGGTGECTFNLTRQQLETLRNQIDAAIAQDDATTPTPLSE